MKISHLNIRSLLPHFQDFQELVDQNSYDVICLTETWLNSNIDSSAISLNGYTLYRKDRDQGQRGGGIVVYISNKLKLTCSVLDIHCTDCDFEHLFLKLNIKGQTCIIATIYRPPQRSLNSTIGKLDEIISSIIPTVNEFILLGDTNVNHFNLSNPLDACLNSFGLRQIIEESTRTTPLTQSLLDPIFVSDPDKCHLAGVVDVDFTDHKLVYCNLNISVSKFKPKLIKIRDFKNFDVGRFSDDLNNISWHEFYRTTDINKKVEFLTQTLITLFNAHAPLRVIRVSKPKAPWLTDVIKVMMKERDKALIKFKRTKSYEDGARYRELRNFVLSCVRREKKIYANHMFSLNDKKGWQALSCMGIKVNKNKEIPSNLASPDEINNYFSDFVNKTNGNCLKTADMYQKLQCLTINKFDFEMATMNEVSDCILSIKSNVAGCDELSVRMLGYCMPLILPQICHIVNVCLEKGEFPTSWKQANVHPIPKTNNPLELSDLRPICLLPVLSKVLEKVVFKQVVRFLTENQIFPDHQSGFREAHSTITALLKVMDDICRSIDNKNLVALVLLDFSKAFDTVDHNLLCSKLKFIGFNKVPLKFFENYLSGRTQRVVFNGELSNPSSVYSGVPQGSILGPLLFLIYTFDLFSKLKSCSVHGYADDTQLYYSFTSNDSLQANIAVNQDLNIIHDFSVSHNLTINAKKSNFLLFGGTKKSQNCLNNNFCPSINHEKIPYASSAKNLGLIFDSNLRFREHVTGLLRRSYATMKILYANKNVLSFNLKKSLCESLIFSIFNYGCTIYGPCLDVVTRNRIQRVQRICARFVFGLTKYEPVSEKLKILRWLPLSKLWEIQILTFTHRLLTTCGPDYLRQKIYFRSDLHHLPTRGSNLLAIPRFKSDLFKRSFSYIGVKLFNSIDDSFKRFSTPTFKRKIKQKYLQDFLSS